jgi:hypothetical protein
MLPLKKETMTAPEGIECRVLDSEKVDFSNAVWGRKATETRVLRAKGGELIQTEATADGSERDAYIAEEGDAIFQNLNNEKDIYIPSGDDGKHWKFDDFLKHGYEVSSGDLETDDMVLVKSTNSALILPEAVTEPIVIPNAFGEGNHQYLYAGATLKDAGAGRVTGIGKEAFDATWEILGPQTQSNPCPTAQRLAK